MLIETLEDTYFEVGPKRTTIDKEVSELMKVESGQLDVPRRSYEFLKMTEFCRCVGHNFCSKFVLNFVPNGAELGDVINTKVIYLCLSFPNNFSLLNLEVCSSSYKILSKESLN